MRKFFEEHIIVPKNLEDDFLTSKLQQRDYLEHDIAKYLKTLGLKMNTDARRKEKEYYKSKPGVITFVEEIQISPSETKSTDSFDSGSSTQEECPCPKYPVPSMKLKNFKRVSLF